MMASRSNDYGILREYHNYLVELVDDENGTLSYNYSHLMGLLDDISFRWSIDLDEDRADDGLMLRGSYGYLYHDDSDIVVDALGDTPCSLLEMLVALSLRCYDEFLSGFDERVASPHKVFWDMIRNLGLTRQSDDNFSFKYVMEKCDTFLDRKYRSDGKGNIFRVNPHNLDCRKTEIWWQMMRYTDTYFNY